jgi:hypothetical protein
MTLGYIRNRSKTITLLRYTVLLALAVFGLSGTLSAQKFTRVKGKVFDANSKEPLPFVNIAFKGTNVGMTTDFNGSFNLESKWASDTLQVSYVGYDTEYIPVIMGKTQTIDVELKETGTTLETVTITAKKKRYRKKNNPAVELIRKVIDNKDRNRIEGQEYYEFDKYEKVEMDLNNISDKFRNRKIFKDFQFIFENVDTSEINGKPFLPVYIQETKSKVYYRNKPESIREYREAVSQSGLDKYWDDQGIAQLTDALYQDVDIYEPQIMVVDVPFTGPLSPIAPDFYRFYIIDTIEMDGLKVIDLAFMPRNKQDFGFVGDLFVTADTNYTIVKADLGITKRINMNWVDDIKIIQKFSQTDSVWLLTEDKVIIDFKISKKGIGFYGRKSNFYSNYLFNEQRDDQYYNGADRVVDANDNVFNKSDDYWQSARPVPLDKNEQSVYNMIDTIQTIPAFRNTLDVVNLLMTGYWSFGGFDVGPINGFYSFNDIQGGIARFGGETNLLFNKKIQLEGQVLYAFNEKAFRFSVGGVYSFNKDWQVNPRHEIRLTYQQGTNFPGQNLNFVNEDNFLLSFKRGPQNKLIDFELYHFSYFKELENNISYKLIFERRDEAPLGPSFNFNYFDGQNDQILSSISTTQVGLELRWAPNEQFIQARDYRYSIPNFWPIFELKYYRGLDNVLGGNYNFNRATFNIFKKWNFSILGYAHMNAEVGKVWGNELPYLLMFIPRANQTYAYQSFSYNMMNFLEFTHDQYASVNIRYYFNGFILNKIPLLRRLKLREIVSLKALYGRISDKNNPNLPGNEHLVQLPRDPEGNPSTFTLEKEPYIEASVGISNIFKILTVDFVQRVNYLDLPNTPSLFGVKGLGVRFRAGIEF